MPISTLDRVLEEANLQRPVLLKVDVQGFEEEMLRGARRTLAQVDDALVESSLVPMYHGEPTLLELAQLPKESGLVLESQVGCLESPRIG